MNFTKKIFLIAIFSLQMHLLSAEKILIFTYSYNRPDFIEIQDKTFKKFLKDDYEFIVFNDASSSEVSEQIVQTCNKLNLQCIRIPQEIHLMPYLERLDCERHLYNHPTIRNCNVVQYSLNNLGFKHHGIVALFDSDLFLIKDFSIKDFLENYDLAGFSQSRNSPEHIVEYLWIGLVFLNMETMPNHDTINFNCGQVEGISVDAGGHTYDYLHENDFVKLKRFNQLSSPFLSCKECEKEHLEPCLHNESYLRSLGFSEIEINFLHAGPTNCEFFQDRAFFHYRGGSNWDNRTAEYHLRKTEILYDFIDRLLKN